MPKGEKVLAQSKRIAPPPISKKLNVFQEYFSIGILLSLKGGENSISIIKTLLNTKRMISFRGNFCLVKGKAFETGGENFKT
jgi:hypothetical protein